MSHKKLRPCATLLAGPMLLSWLAPLAQARYVREFVIRSPIFLGKF